VKSSTMVNRVVTGAEGQAEGKRFNAFCDGLKVFEERLSELEIAPEIARQLVSRHTDFSYSKGTIIFRPGAPADMQYCVRRGLVGLYAPTQDRNRILVGLAGPGDLLGNMDFGGETVQSRQIWEAHARHNCELALISRVHIAQTLQTLKREILVQFFERIAAQWSFQLHRWVRFLGLDYRRRLELVIDELAVQFGVSEARGILLTPELSHSDFAELIASSRPLVTKLIGELIAAGSLIQQGKQYIVPRTTGNRNQIPRANANTSNVQLRA
jgi:CRP-like cAMP-binding protein